MATVEKRSIMTTTLYCYSYRLKVTFHLLFSVIKPHSVITDSYQQKPECCLHQPSPGWIITVPRPRIIPRDRPPLIAAMAYTVTMAGPCRVIPCAPLIHDRHHRAADWSEMIGDRAVKKEGTCCPLKWGSNLSEAAMALTIILKKRKRKKKSLKRSVEGPEYGSMQHSHSTHCALLHELHLCDWCRREDLLLLVACTHSVHFNTLPVCASMGERKKLYILALLTF